MSLCRALYSAEEKAKDAKANAKDAAGDAKGAAKDAADKAQRAMQGELKQDDKLVKVRNVSRRGQALHSWESLT